MKFYAIIRCNDCTGQDDKGCFDGGTETLGPFDTHDEADTAGSEYTNNCGPWDWDVEQRP